MTQETAMVDLEDVVRQRVRGLRRAQGWTLDDLAERSAISPSTLSRIETGHRRIALDQLVPIAHALAISLDQLVEPVGDEDVVIRPTAERSPGLTTWMLSSTRTLNGLVVARMRITRGRPVDPRSLRVHAGREWFTVLVGTATLALGDRVVRVREGEAAEFSTMVPHAISAERGSVDILTVFDHEGRRAHLRSREWAVPRRDRGDMTRQVVARAFGGPEELQVVEVPSPEPGDGEVRIAVRAVGVNPYDWKQYSGTGGVDPANLTTFGSELSGVIEAVGDRVEAWAVGDEVIATGFRAGSYADAVVVPERALYPMPSGMPFDQAAVVSVVGGAAWHLIHATGVHEGDRVLVHNGAGGVGGVVVQLALLRGAAVIATGGPANQEHLRRLGAVPVVYGPGLLHRIRDAAPGGVDVAIDCIGTDEAVDTSVALVVDRSRIATIAAFGRAPGLGIKLLGNGPGADPGSEVRRAGRPEVAQLVADGRLELPIAGTYSLEQTAAAHRESRSGHVAGKLVVIP